MSANLLYSRQGGKGINSGSMRGQDVKGSIPIKQHLQSRPHPIMKTTSLLRSRLVLVASSLMAISYASAQSTLTWDPAGGGASDGAGTWLATGEWWDGANNVDWTSGDSAIFGNGGAGGTVTAGTLNAGSVLLDDFTGTYTLQGTGTTLTQTGGITIGATAGNVIIKGTGSSANRLTLSGAGGITMNGSGLLNLSSNLIMNYTGSTVINSGVVMLGNAGDRSTGNFNLNGGMLTDYYRQTHIFSAGLGTGDNQIQIHGESGFGGGNGTSNYRIGANNSVLTWGDTNFDPTKLKFRAPLGDNNGPSIYGIVSLQNRLDLNSGTRTIDVYSVASVGRSSATIAGGIQDTGGTGNLVKSGDGTLLFGVNTSTWGGTTTVSGGFLDFGGTNIANIGGGSGRNISVAAGAVVRFNAASSAIMDRIVASSDEFTVMTGTTGNAIDFSSHTGAFLSNYAGNGAKTELTGIITPGGGAYRLGAPAQSGALGIRQASLLSGANELIIGGNRVVIVGNHTFTGDTTIRDGARLGLAGLNADAVGVRNNSSGLQNSVPDLGAPTATGTLFLESGLTAGAINDSTTSANGGTTSATFGGLKGSRDLVSTFVVGNVGNNTNGTVLANITGFTLNPGTGVTASYSGAIGGFGAGATGSTGGTSTLTKTGDGTQILSGASTYAGGTTISQGALIVNNTTGSGTGSGAVSVGANGTLGGTGTISGATAVDGTLAAGNSIGKLGFGNNLTMNSGSTFGWELTANVTGRGTNYDAVNVAGTLGGSGAVFKAILTSGSFADGFWTNNQTWTDIFKTADAGSNIDFSSVFTGGFQYWQGTTNVTAGINDYGSFSISGSDLNWTAIPEPSTALGGLLLTAGLLRRCRQTAKV